MTTNKRAPKKRRVYDEMDALRLVQGILVRVEPPAARARVMRFLTERFADEQVQEAIMADPRQTEMFDQADS